MRVGRPPSHVEKEQWLVGSEPESFVERAAYYTREINAVHPFREGNRRAIRFYLDVLSAAPAATSSTGR